MIGYYATHYQSETHCGAFRHGVLVLVRLKDNCVLTLDVAETNRFRIRVYDYELSADDRDPFTRACNDYKGFMYKKSKYIVASLGGAIIEFHNEPLTVRA